MNPEQVKEKLLALFEPGREPVDFTVVFSRKKGTRVNGCYNPDSREIMINNGNFGEGEGGDNLLFYTAVHELAHHLLNKPKQKSLRGHTGLFWATLDNLIETAEEKGLYRAYGGEEISNLVKEVRRISAEIAALQRDLGKVIRTLYEKSRKAGVRGDDLIYRRAGISRKTERKALALTAASLPENLGIDFCEAALRRKEGPERAAVISAANKGRSIDQAERGGLSVCGEGTPEEEKEPEEEAALLKKERGMLERTITTLQIRLKSVMEKLNALTGGKEEGGG